MTFREKLNVIVISFGVILGTISLAHAEESQQAAQAPVSPVVEDEASEFDQAWQATQEAFQATQDAIGEMTEELKKRWNEAKKSNGARQLEQRFDELTEKLLADIVESYQGSKQKLNKRSTCLAFQLLSNSNNLNQADQVEIQLMSEHYCSEKVLQGSDQK